MPNTRCWARGVKVSAKVAMPASTRVPVRDVHQKRMQQAMASKSRTAKYHVSSRNRLERGRMFTLHECPVVGGEIHESTDEEDPWEGH